MDFALFKPIESNVREEAAQYYADNNIALPENAFFTDFIGTETPKEESTAKVEAPKKSPIKFALEELPKPAKKEWSFENTTIPDLIERSDTRYPGKTKFLDEVDAMKLVPEDKKYLIKLAEVESSFNPKVTNQFGYFGYYQFGKEAMKDTGFKRRDLRDPMNQHKAALKLADLNLIPFTKYIGTEVNGITLTKNALRAAAHLAGAGGLKDYLEGTHKTDFARRGFVDGNGTHISRYLEEFSA